MSIGRDGGLYGTPHGGSAELLVPGLGGFDSSGLQALANGHLVLADSESNRLLEVTLDGAKDTLLGGLAYPNGVTVDMRENVCVAEHDAGRVHRVVPETGASSVVAEGLDNPNGLNFDPEYKVLYIGSFGGGSIHQVEIDAEGEASNLRLFVEGLESDDPGGGSGGGPGGGWGEEGGGIDGLGVDACGNVYATEYVAAVIWRITPDGTKEELLRLSDDSFWIPNLHWGSGYGGWDRQHLYVMDREKNQVYDIDLGIPGKEEPHL
ncbi:MAG: SMP-30/gluconolactonase/LRE family protein [Nannocystaceae bacterium]